MAARKGRADDLNAPLRTLSERLRSLQREAGDLLETARREARRNRRRAASGDETAESAPPTTLDNPLLRAANNLLERWDTPTRTELAALAERIERIERALVAHQMLEPVDESDGAPPTSPPPRRHRRLRRKE